YPKIYVPGFDQYNQEILDDSSGLYEFAPEIVIFALGMQGIFPEINGYYYDMSEKEIMKLINARLEGIAGLVKKLDKKISPLVLFHNFIQPDFPLLGINDAQAEMGQAEVMHAINKSITDMLKPVSSAHMVDIEGLYSFVGKKNARDIKMWYIGKFDIGEAVLPHLTCEYMRFIKAFKGKNRKCLVLDLDNTLWGGIIGEEGIANIKLGTEDPVGRAFVDFQIYIKAHTRKGIMLAVCSKNNEEDAFEVFEKHEGMVLKKDDIACFKINWKDKSANIREIASELNIGLDSLVFVDDNPAERELVRQQLGEVAVIDLPVDPALYVQALRMTSDLEVLNISKEDAARTKMYKQQAERKEHMANFENLDEYYSSLEMQVSIKAVNDTIFPRVSQLVNKTNQFNLTTKRYTEGELKSFLKKKGNAVYALELKDKFGENGLTGVIMLEEKDSAWLIDNFLLSCRIIGRKVETALIAYVLKQAKKNGVKEIIGKYIPTAKNALTKEVYKLHGFEMTSEEKGSTEWKAVTGKVKVEFPSFIRVIT
ncbi:HAD-IIIC family phosphatase, partial [Spirochaetota bacterium]